MIALLRDRWDGAYEAEGIDLLSIAEGVFGEGRPLVVRYSSDENSPEVASITELSPHGGELVLASVLAVEDET